MLDYINDTNPANELIEAESMHTLLCFCTFCTLIKGKKLSLQNVFLLVLQEKRYRDVLKYLLGLDTDIQLVQSFIDLDPTLVKSKYITRYLNSHDTLKFK